VLNQNVSSSGVVAVLLVDLESLLVHANLNTLGGNVLGTVLGKVLNVVSDTSTVRLASSEHKQVLEVSVVAEGGGLKNDLLEKLNQLSGHISIDEGLDGDRHTLRVLRLGNGSGNNLVNKRATVHVVGAENVVPDLQVLTFEQVTSLCSEHGIVVGDLNKLEVVLALAVGNVGEVGVALLAVFTNNHGVVHIILLEELLRIVVAVDVDLGKSVVDSLLCVASLESGFQERQQELQAVSGLNFRDKLINRNDSRVDRAQQVLDYVLVTVDIKQATDDTRSSARVDTLDVDLDRLEVLVLVEVQNQIVNKVEAIANNDQRKLLGKVGFLQEVLDLLGVKVVRFSADTFHFLDLAHCCGGFNVLEGDLLILAQVDDTTEVVVETLGSSVLLEKGNDAVRTEQVRVLLRNVDNGGEILADVNLQHLVQALHRKLESELAEEVDQELLRNLVRLNNDTLDGSRILVVLQSSCVQTSLLAKGGNTRTIVVGEHLVTKDSIGDLRSVHQVHLDQASLERTILFSVCGQNIETECSSLLDHALRHEDVEDTRSVDEVGVLLGESSSELSTLLRVDSNDVLEESVEVRCVASLL